MSEATKILVRHERDDDLAASAPVRWALDQLFAALRERSIEPTTEASASCQLSVTFTGSREHAGLHAVLPSGTRLPEKAEAFAIARQGDGLIVWGADVRGMAYATTELADRVRYRGLAGLEFKAPLIEEPAARIRSIVRAFSCEAIDKAWFYDRVAWQDYLSMLASNRFNRFSLTLGMAYNYPYHNNMIRDVYFHFAYPFLVSVLGSPIRVASLSDDERDLNLDTIRFIGREAVKRGLDFHLGLWTHRYDFAKAVDASHRIDGVTDDNFSPFCRQALVQILQECPEISGVTFRIHVEGGIEEGDYGFWENLFGGVASVGRPIEIDLHPKGLDHTMVEVAQQTGMPVVVSPKYIAEHMALPYHTASIRESEFPPEVTGDIREQLSRGTRRFLRHSYGDLLSKDRDWKVLFRIWPGTQKVLLWGDPELSSGYGRSSGYCGADGVELCEPQTFRGRMGAGMPGGRHNYKQRWLVPERDWEKYEYQYRVWGRRLFSPDTDIDDCSRFLEAKCGDAAPACQIGLAYASRVLPLVTQVHGPSVSNNLYWPEIYTNLAVLGDGLRRPYGGDTDPPIRFGNVSTFDPQLFANAREYAENLLTERGLRKYNPFDYADWLEDLGRKVDEQVAVIRNSTASGTPDVFRISVDLQVLSGIARFFAEKFHAACWAEVFLLTAIDEARRETVRHLKRGMLFWKSVADVSKDVYQDDLSFGMQHYMRGNWASRLGDIQNEALDVEAWREDDQPKPRFPDEEGLRYLAALRGRVPTISRKAAVDCPETFAAGEDIAIRIDAGVGDDPILHYRHVNQAERWVSLPMAGEGEKYSGRIPAEYSRSKFHIQFYTTARDGDALIMSPGFVSTLSNEPYHTILQR